MNALPGIRYCKCGNECAPGRKFCSRSCAPLAHMIGERNQIIGGRNFRPVPEGRLKAREVAIELQTSDTQIYRLARTGVIPCQRTEAGVFSFDLGEVRRVLAAKGMQSF